MVNIYIYIYNNNNNNNNNFGEVLKLIDTWGQKKSDDF